jgi:hypothetical protein
MSSKTKLHHVNQPSPNAHSWHLWQWANHLWTSCGTKLKQLLSRWLEPAEKLCRLWKAYFDPSAHELLICLPAKHYNIHSIHPQGFQIQPDGHTNELPSGCRPAWILKGPTVWAVRTTKPIIQIMTNLNQSDGMFDAFIQDLPAVSKIKLHEDLYSIHHGLVTYNTSMGVSDGSMAKKSGAYGWCLSSTDGTRLATGMGPAQGMKPSLYHAEGYGMLSLLRFIIQLRNRTLLLATLLR